MEEIIKLKDNVAGEKHTHMKREIGRIKLVQVQRSSLKLGERLRTWYDPAPLLTVEKLLLLPKGVVGMIGVDQEIMDIHHMDHPDTRNSKGRNGVSLGFTAHYRAMRAQFGEHLSDGIAGENIIVESDRSFALADLGEQVIIESSQTGQCAYLAIVKAAAPCVEFTQYAANHGMPLAAAELKAALQFLENGRRGFYVRALEQDVPVVVQTGDRVCVDDGE